MTKQTDHRTPRTDRSSFHSGRSQTEFTKAELSRQLERELAEAKAEIKRLGKVLKRIASIIKES